MQNENEKFNNESLQKFNLYMIKDKETGIHSLLYQTASDDRNACNEILNYLGSVFKGIKNKSSKVKFMEKLHDSYIVKVGSVDILTGLLVPDYNVLADLRDVEVKKKEEKDENGKKED